MFQQQQVAVVLGATGMIGSILTNLLLKDPAFSKVRVLVRRPLHLIHPRLEVQVTDLHDTNDIQSKLGTGDCIFSCLGTTRQAVQGDESLYWKIDHDIPVNTATLGKAAGFHTFLLVSVVGAKARTTNFYLQLKGMTEQDLAAQNYRNFYIFRPSLLLGHRTEKRLGESIAQKVMPLLSPLMMGPLEKYKPIEAIAVAKAMIAAARLQQPGKLVYEYREMMELADPAPSFASEQMPKTA